MGVTRVRLRTTKSQGAGAADVILLDLFGLKTERPAATVYVSDWSLIAAAGTTPASDVLRLAVAVYCADLIVPRRAQPDGWTREIELSVPVVERAAFEAAADDPTEAITFLSGDQWDLQFRALTVAEREEEGVPLQSDAVCLLSGGLDSLAGAIDLLSDGAKLTTLGHYESATTKTTQSSLVAALSGRYGHLSHRQFGVQPNRRSPQRERPLPPTRERTTRTRSLLFIAAGLALASSVSGACPLYMPENGFIGVNVPVASSRVGSLSTRTTHPHFLAALGRGLTKLGITNEVLNPFRLLTKGEVLQTSREPNILATTAQLTLSCAHPDYGRFLGRARTNCGWCYPCLLRRAAMASIGADDGSRYLADVLDPNIAQASPTRRASLEALRDWLARDFPDLGVLANGPLEGETQAFAELVRRGRAELDTWLT
jgi:hypothetical protein